MPLTGLRNLPLYTMKDFRHQNTPCLTPSSRIAQDTEARLVSGLRREGVQHPRVMLLHRDLQMKGNWAVVPILPALHQISLAFGSVQWFVFLPENADVDLELFQRVMASYPTNELALVGRLLKDEAPTMVHLQVLQDVKYPGVLRSPIELTQPT